MIFLLILRISLVIDEEKPIRGENISTTEVEEVLNVFDQVLMSTVYGVKISGTDGRAGIIFFFKGGIIFTNE